LAQHAQTQIVLHPDLTRKANIWREIFFSGEAVALGVAHRVERAFDDFDAAGRAFCVAAAAVENVNSSVPKGEYEFLSNCGFERLDARRGFGFDFRHRSFSFGLFDCRQELRWRDDNKKAAVRHEYIAPYRRLFF